MRSVTEYHRPQQLEEALRLLARRDVRTVLLGGGSDLVAEGRRDVEAVVDLRDLGLSYIRREGDVLRIGATTTLQALIDSPESAPAWGGELARAIEHTAARNLREQGTIAGTLVAAAGNNPLAVMLLALDASLTILTPARKTVSLDDFFPNRQSLLHGALIIEIIVPLPHPGAAAAFEKVSRTPADLPIVCAAVRAQIEGALRVARQVRIGLGGVGRLPMRALRVEQSLEGRPLDQQSIEEAVQAIGDLDPLPDFLGSREYRREMAAILARRAIERCLRG